MTLTAAIGRYAHTEALLASPLLSPTEFPVISRAFAPMVREHRFDVSEMAIATFLQARAAGSDLVLLPVVLSARFQNGAILRRANDPFGPGDLAGKRVGVRAYSQTTGLWLRGILQDSYGVLPDTVRWVTFEDAHVAAYRDPPWAERAPPGSDMLAMLRDGRLDAAIFGNDTPTASDLATVFPDPGQAGRDFMARHDLLPINHMLCLRAPIAAQPGTARALMDHLRPSPLPFGRQAIDPAVTLALRYATQQGLLARPLTLDDVWQGLPPDCAE
jgi:4,5-dihydroxyphthalate decarboxylase